MAFRALGRVVTALAGRQPRPVLAVPLIIVVLIAVVQSIARNDWLIAAVLIGVAAATVLAPLAQAKNGRRSELAADRFAADRGLAAPLASALVVLAGGRPSALRRRDVLASHPTFDERIDVLAASTPSQEGATSPAGALRFRC